MKVSLKEMNSTQNQPEMVVNVYAYRTDLSNPDVYVHRTAPHGKLYYIVNPNPEVANRKYLYRLKRDRETRTVTPIWAPFREYALAWDCVDLAAAYCKFIRYLCPNETHYYVVLEPGNRRSPTKGEMR
jgi:hypothetical protein